MEKIIKKTWYDNLGWINNIATIPPEKHFDPITHDNNIFSKYNTNWDYTQWDPWIGNRYPLPNLSGGWHGLIYQWISIYSKKFTNPKVLLVSESVDVKKQLQEDFLNWKIETTDLYWDLQSKPDIIADICKPDSLPKNKYNLVINSAMLEHVYDPFIAMKNMFSSIDTGFLISTTHPPHFGYHQHPRDYMRFVIDWWYDMPKNINDNIELIELYQLDQDYVFTCYEKLNNK